MSVVPAVRVLIPTPTVRILLDRISASAQLVTPCMVEYVQVKNITDEMLTLTFCFFFCHLATLWPTLTSDRLIVACRESLSAGSCYFT